MLATDCHHVVNWLPIQFKILKIMRYLLIIFMLISWSIVLPAQGNFQKTPEFQLSYFGEYYAHPGIKVGYHLPFRGSVKNKYRQKRGITKTKLRQFKVGGNLALYQQKNHHTGYLANVELTYQRTKFKSHKPNKIKHFEAAIGLGYYHYQLQGTTFTTDNNSFKETNGNGNALMPSISVGWGRTLSFIKRADVRYFTKGSLYFEVPHGIGTMPHSVIEFGISTSLNFKRRTR